MEALNGWLIAQYSSSYWNYHYRYRIILLQCAKLKIIIFTPKLRAKIVSIQWKKNLGQVFVQITVWAFLQLKTWKEKCSNANTYGLFHRTIFFRLENCVKRNCALTTIRSDLLICFLRGYWLHRNCFTLSNEQHCIWRNDIINTSKSHETHV